MPMFIKTSSCPINDRFIIYEETWSSSWTRAAKTDMFRSGIEPGPPRWEASALENSY